MNLPNLITFYRWLGMPFVHQFNHELNTLVSRAGMSPVGINQPICAGVMGAWSAPLVAAEAAECDRASRPGIAGRSRDFFNPQFSLKFCISNYKIIRKKNSLVACRLGSLALYPLAAMPKIVRATHHYLGYSHRQLSVSI